MKIEKGTGILLVSSAGFVFLLLLAVLFSRNLALSTNFIFLAMIFLFVPYSVYKFFEQKRIKAYEKEFPSLLRDLAESQRAGLSILQAIKVATRSDYGSLTDEVKKISNQISWNVPLEEILGNFRKRMKSSGLIVRSIMVVSQANKSGGNIEDTMDSLASNIEMIRDVQEEKSTLLNQQVFMMYAIFFVFVGITIALVKFLIPMVQTPTAQTGFAGITQGMNANPCSECAQSSSIACVSCNAFFAVSAALDLGAKEEPATYYKSLFFVMIVMQGFFSGLIAGQIGADSVAAGVKHSLIMLLSGVFVFILIAKAGVI
ncbi:MAG: type II secretion system F family protein [Candidatus Aenigmarchaeota archaeon]|nr:type II secretion system F family protein [Candidatus Aenigmarchaeota archaeon]